MTLLKLGLWDAQKYPMLNKFTENYQAWRQAIADYEDISLADAKVELIRIFYGGKPTREIPFLLKVCDEVQKSGGSIAWPSIVIPRGRIVPGST